MFLLVASAVISALAALPVMGLERFQDTNQLVWDASFKRELARFLQAASEGQSGGLGNPERLQPSMLELIGGPPDPKARTPNGNFLFTACRPHSCPEKGGVVLAPEGRIIAVGVISISAPDSDDKNPENPALFIWVDDAAKGAADAVDSLTSWGMPSISPAPSKGPFVTRFSSDLR